MEPGQSRKKIFYLITKSNFGGAQRYVYDLATSLSADKYDVKVICGEGGTLKDLLEQKDIETELIAGLVRDVSIWSDFKTFFRLVKKFKSEKPDVIHLNSSKISGLGALAGRLAGVKRIIFTAHGWAFNEERRAFSRLVIRLLYWITILLCHQTIAVSEKTKNQVSSLPWIKKRITVVHNGINKFELLDRAVARDELSQRTDFIATEKALIIGTISELHKSKGLDFLINTFAMIARQIPHAAIWIIGEGEEREKLQKLIAEKKLAERVFLLGRVPEAAKYLEAFDIFTLTSRTEGLPYVLLEAGYAGLPTIASRVGGIPEVIPDHDHGVLIRRGHSLELRYALLKLAQMKKNREPLGKNLKKFVTKNFSLEKMVRETTSLYQ